MQENLLMRLAPKLKQLDKGGYRRTYRGRGGKAFPTGVHLLVAEILDSLGVSYSTDVKVLQGSALAADFAFDDTLLFVERELSPLELNRLGREKKCILISSVQTTSDRLDPGIRVIQLGGKDEGRLQTIFLDDPSFNFDYAHILPHTQKCSVMHGHTSSALVEIIGRPTDGMVVDFGLAKDIVREAIRKLDHKLFINKKYVKGENKTHVTLSFKTVHGDFKMQVPKGTTVLLRGEATVENLAAELLSLIAPRMHDNVTAVGVYVYEGMNKGTHLLARIHSQEGDRRRRMP
ncbi:MAG: 6-carboxytetrahydropterin synthase [Thaumarchaeota archaeon]|nr:6-carboxytetrahydropterin synthase [Nitrososphaerota archaeon]